MTTPVYEVGIYTYKSPVSLKGADIIGVRDINGNDTSIGVNTIGDYDKYYISDSRPTFGATFVPSSVGTIDDAFAGNSYGTAVTQTITNSFTVSNTQLIVPGYIRPSPLIPGATLTVNLTNTPIVSSFTSTLTVPYNPKLTVTQARITAPMYKCLANQLTTFFYKLSVSVKNRVVNATSNPNGNYLYNGPFDYSGGGLSGNLVTNFIYPSPDGLIPGGLNYPKWDGFNEVTITRTFLYINDSVSRHFLKNNQGEAYSGPYFFARDTSPTTSNPVKFKGLQNGLNRGGRYGFKSDGLWASERFSQYYYYFVDNYLTTSSENIRITDASNGPVGTFYNTYEKIAQEVITTSGITPSDFDFNRAKYGYYTYPDTETGRDNNTTPRNYAAYFRGGSFSRNGVSYPSPQPFVIIEELLSTTPRPGYPFNINLGNNISFVYLRVANVSATNMFTVYDTPQLVAIWVRSDTGDSKFAFNGFDVSSYYGYGTLNKTSLSDFSFSIDQEVGGAWSVDNGGYRNSQGTHTANANSFGSRGELYYTEGGNRTLLVSSSSANSNAAYQYSYRLNNPLAVESYADVRVNSSIINSLRVYSKDLYNKNLTLTGVELLGLYTDGSLVQISARVTPSTAGNYGYLSMTNLTPTPTPPEKLSLPTASNVTIDANIVQCINSDTQNIQLNSFSTNNDGIQATSSEGTVFTLINQSALVTTYDSSAKGEATEGNSNDTVGKVYLQMANATLNATVQYQGSSSFTASASPLTTESFNVTVTGTNILTITQSNSDFNSFINSVLTSANFNSTRTLNINSSTNTLTSVSPGPLFSFNFGSSMTNLYAKPPQNWSLSITYTPSVLPSNANIYKSDGSSSFSVSPNTFTSGFNSNGTLVNGTLTRQSNEQVISVYRLYDKTTLANTWISGNSVSVPALSLTTFGETVLPANCTFASLSIPVLVSFVGDLANYNTFTLTNSTGATILSASVLELTYPGNAILRTFDITSYLQSALSSGGSVNTSSIVSSFNVSTNTIGAASFQLPSDFYTSSIAGSTLNFSYRWGDHYNYKEYSETFPMGTPGLIDVDQATLSPAASSVILFNKPDRQRLLSTPSTVLYLTTISSNPTGYSFAEVPFMIKDWDPATPYAYKIHNLSSGILLSGDNASLLFNINDNVDRTKPERFISSPFYSSQLSTLESVGGEYTTHGSIVTGFSMSGVGVTGPLINQFLQLDDVSTGTSAKSLYLFVTPQIDFTLVGPSLAAETNPYIMPDYTGYISGVSGRMGIPTFGVTLHRFNDYILTNEPTQLAGLLNTFEYSTTTPFSTFTAGTISPDQVSGFIAQDYRYKYFVAATNTDANTSLYALPFNWNTSGPGSYNIAYANNFITLQFLDVDASWISAPNQIIRPAISAQPLYMNMNLDFSLYNAGSQYTASDVSALYLKDSDKKTIGQFTLTGNTFSVEFIGSNFIPGTIYSDYDSPIYISPVFSSNVTIPDYVLRRFYIPTALTVTSASSFMSAAFTTTTGLFRTTLNINLGAGGSISYAGAGITGFADQQSRFAIVIPGIPEVTFDIASNGTASIVIPYLMPATTYNNVSIRYYPYRTNTNTKLQPLSEVARLAGFGFTTPAGYVFSAAIVLTYDANNQRACSITVNRASLTSGSNALPISNYELVLDTGTTVRIASGSTFSHGVLTVPGSYENITYYLTEMVHGQLFNPILYAQKVDGLTYKSNLLLTPVVNIPLRNQIRLDVSGTLLYKKDVTLTNYDVYEQFLVKDFSLPENFGGEIQILKGTTGFSYGTTGPTGSSLTLDLNNVDTGVYSDFNVCYTRNHFVPRALTQMVNTDKTGMRDQREVRNVQGFYDSFTTKSGFSAIPLLNQNTVLFGPIVRARYTNSTTYDRINYAVNTPAALLSLVEFFTANGATTIYDPTGLYAQCSGSNASVTGKLNSSRIDALGNVSSKYYLNSYTAATGTTMGTLNLTYANGAVYTGLELNPFYHKVISIKKGTVPIFITYLTTGNVYLSDYVQTNVGFTADACIYNGYSIELSYPEDVSTNITVYRDTFPTTRDGNGIPTYRLDDFFSRISQFSCVYFQTQSQINDWNSSLVSDYWWTSPLTKLRACPFQILNKLTSVGVLPPVTVITTPQLMTGQIVTYPALFYGRVTINNFQYYSIDRIENSFPVVYNGGTLTLVDASNTVYGSVTVPPVYAQDITIALDKKLLRQNTTYNLTLVYTYSEAALVGKSTLPVTYVVPTDETSIKDYTSNELIHKLNITIDADNTFGNLPLSSIITPSKLSLKNLSSFTYSGAWSSGVTYSAGNAVLQNGGLYWLTDIANYRRGSPEYGYGWDDTSTYINYRGAWSSGLSLQKNDVILYNGVLYKAGSAITRAPLVLDRDTGTYPDYTTDILAQNAVIPYPFAGGATLNYTFDGCIPRSTYNVSYSLEVGNTFSTPISLGDYLMLPSGLDCRGVTFNGTNILLTDVSYEKSSIYFRDGVMNYQGSSFAFGGTGVTIAYSGTIGTASYTPQLALDIRVPDETDQYNIYPVGLTLTSSIQGPTLTHNSAIFQVLNFNAPPFTLNTNDYIGVFHGETFWSEFQLTNSVISNNYGNFILPIRNLASLTTYVGFNFRYRINNTHYYTGIPKQLPTFATPPILVIQLSVSTGAVNMSARIRSVTYCSNLLPTFFPTTNDRNKIALTFKSLASLSTKTPFVTPPGLITSPSNPFVFIPLIATTAENYTFDFVHIEYTFVDELDTLNTLIVERPVTSSVRFPVTVTLSI